MADSAEDTRKEYVVLKEWDVTDTILPYYGTHAVGDVVFVHEDVAAPLVEDGTLELKETEVAEEAAPDTEAPAPEVAPVSDPAPAEGEPTA